MPTWVDVAAETDCPVGQAVEVIAAGKIISLFHTEDGYFATDGMCAHQGGPLAQGQLCKNIITCPWHGWQYDVTTGKHELSSIHLDRYAVKVEAGRVWVSVEN